MTAVRQLTLSIGTLAIVYVALITLLHKSLTHPITKQNFWLRHILIPIAVYGVTIVSATYYFIPEKLKSILPIDSSLVRNTLADMLSRSIGLSINLLCITAILFICIDKLLYLYNNTRIPILISYLITISFSVVAYNTFFTTLSRQKDEIVEHTELLFKMFLGLEIFLSIVIALIVLLIIANYIKSKTNKI